MIDFEIAALSAFTSHYETDIKGCYFHLCQSFMRKISELGLKKTYESNSELVLALNMIPALSFVPESKVEIGAAILEYIRLSKKFNWIPTIKSSTF